MTLFAVLGALVCLPLMVIAWLGTLSLYGGERLACTGALLALPVAGTLFLNRAVVAATILTCSGGLLLAGAGIAKRRRRLRLRRESLGSRPIPTDIRLGLRPTHRHENPELDGRRRRRHGSSRD